MKARLDGFGQLTIDGAQYDYDVIIEQGEIRKRRKKPSKEYKAQYGHTPLSVAEELPWHGKQLYIGTGSYGSLPIMPEVYTEAQRRGISIIAQPTAELCLQFDGMDAHKINAILHVTC